MDIGASVSQGQNIMASASAFNADQMRNQADLRRQAQGKYNTTMETARAKSSSTDSLFSTIDKGEMGSSGVTTLLSGARTIGNARNFDSEISGFGTGRGTSGYLRSQGQIARGRVGQARSSVGRALGSGEEAPKSASALGLSKTGGNFPFKEGVADASKIADDTDTGRSVAKASGGLLADAGKGGSSVEGGIAGGLIKKVGGLVSDMPTSQLSAVGDVAGKGLGMFSAGKAVADIFDGQRSKESKAGKYAEDADMVAGGIDALSIAMPMLAPVGAVAGGISALLDIYGEHKDKEMADAASAKKAQGVQDASDAQAQQSGKQVASLSSAGLVAKQGVSQY